MKKILLTSFDTWLPHQSSNASDDLLINWLKQANLSFLRRLPVDIARASERVMNAIEYEKPDIIISCGMAESRYFLTVESNARGDNQRLYTSIDLKPLVNSLTYTNISHNAGKFVCEGLYYQVLKHLPLQTQGLFVHVPLLKKSNYLEIIRDFARILETMSQ